MRFSRRTEGVRRIRYFGGKSRISKEIAAFISSEAKISNGTFISLFCGSCAVETKVQGYDKIICNDAHRYLIAMLRDAQSGRIFPGSVSEDDYREIRANPDEDPGLAGFVGFGCSYAGKWFGGYARNKRGDNYAAQTKRALSRDEKGIKRLRFICGDYRSLRVNSGSVVYADPPYNGTTGYSTGSFDSGQFWDFARKLAESGSSVFISEESGPSWATAIWEKPLRRQSNNARGKTFTATEKLFYLPPGGWK